MAVTAFWSADFSPLKTLIAIGNCSTVGRAEGGSVTTVVTGLVAGVAFLSRYSIALIWLEQSIEGIYFRWAVAWHAIATTAIFGKIAGTSAGVVSLFNVLHSSSVA